ncbi:type I polyketide synthase [Archangium lansingense]|uniref:SDR family NAD(P)-dependent oxidoreductase n=1 Tax=Archangium lansingense TaxID=2995310 RepID=A0ABT3ZWZ3_9BACT|nr:type I polyketide synthase [Archangium lansinium]MCY1073919.1 SDR family NAD(P)-dependent oxidoreductase [Archangium lansinium]
MSPPEQESFQPEAIAIIGMACRFPGAATVEQFWKNLQEGVESIRFLSDEELDRAAIDSAELRDPKYVKARAVLDGIDQFDARFFDFSPREAELTDPQQRVFLECVWEALEKAGVEPSGFPGPIGVYAGAGANGYLLHNLSSAGHLVGTANAFQAVIHNKNDHLSTRVAYKLNLKGPAVTVQTACSTSLVAVYHACQSLLSHQCDLALAGGVTLTVPQNTGYLHHERGIGSPDGHCRPFDAKAQGTVGGSGAGVVLLKRLSEALADGDHIHAVIRGGALNNDGSGKVGYTAPSVDGQAEVISLAQAVSGVEPGSISYVEAHGTATPLGDPIEIQALTQAFRNGGDERKGACAIGSVKSNLGHLDTAAGVAGLLKTALSLEHGKLPPTLHFEKPNPEIDFANSPFYVNAKLSDWTAPAPRRAGVSSFGLGGTNAHVVLEQPPARKDSGTASRGPQLLVLSARSEAALEAMTTWLAEHLQRTPSLKLADVAYTLHKGRKVFDHRRFAVCRDVEDAARTLATMSPDRVFTRVQEPVNRSFSFMFPGQGSQYPGMAADLYRSEPVFRRELDRCLDILGRQRGELRRLLLDSTPDDARAARELDQTDITQPALFAVEYALGRLLLSWGLQPESMIGHSVGEYVAACLAGVFSLEDALGLVALRGRLLHALPPGAMLSVQMAEQDVLPLLGPGLELAAINASSWSVVAGPFEAIDALEKQLSARDVLCRRLRTSHAFHTAMVEPAVAPFREAVARVQRHAPQLRIVSNVTGKWMTAEQAVDPDYWARHLRAPVRFADGLDTMLQQPEAALLEVGPGKVLQTLARGRPRNKPGHVMLTTLPPAGDSMPALEFLLRTVGHLWTLGVQAPELFAGEERRREQLPTYPFERQRYWVDLRASGAAGARRGSLEKRSDVASWFYVPVWKQSAPRVLAAEGSRKKASWLVLVDKTGLGSRVAERLRKLGHDVVEASLGREWRRTGAHAHELNPARREDYANLLLELATEGRLPTRIVHLFGLTPEGPGAASEDILSRSFSSLLHLAQALSGLETGAPVHLTVVSNGMQEVVGGDLSSPEQATALGPCRVIPRELPDVRARSVDVVLPPPGSAQAERLVEQLVAELDSEAGEPAVAFRNGRRWVQDFEALRLEDGAGSAMPLREGGVYLITGGLGGMGLSFAEELASKVKARLVLTGRSEPPPHEDWGRIPALQRMEAQGAQVLALKADVTDAERMRAVIAETLQRFGALHGVIHAAGVPGGGMLQLRTREAIEAVLAPKVKGTQVLVAAIEGLPLDFFVACSSLTSVVGRFGQVDYTAANTFQDAFMRAWQARTGTYAVSVNWGAWDEVGMAARPATRAQEGKPFAHPILHQCLVDTPQRLVFSGTLGEARSLWITDEHRILGNPTVPGVAYLELVRAAIAGRAQGRVIELLDTYFLTPLRVPEKETRELRLILEQDGDGYRWVARSLPKGGTGPSTDHAAGHVRIGGPQEPRFMDLEELRRRCHRPQPASFETEHEEGLGPRWRSVQGIHPGDGELLVTLELMPEFAPDFERMLFHPSLIDRTSGIAKSFLSEHGYYLPFCYKQLRLYADVPRRVVSYARFRKDELTDGETLAFDVVMMDERGRVLAEVERLTQKRVNDPAAELRALAAAARESAKARALPTEETQEILPREGVTALERILAARVMPQVVVSVRDLQTTLEHTDAQVRERFLQAMGETHASGEKTPRPSLKAPYVAPRNELEQRIAEAWQGVLGIDKVGIHDNFLELGGDSVQAIQIIARGNQLGLQLNPQQFFQYSTIAELAGMLSSMLSKQAEQGPVTGPALLTPGQRHFFEQAPREPSRISRVLGLDVDSSVEAATVSKAMGTLLAHHDALRLRFSKKGTEWKQEGSEPTDEVALTEVDLRALPSGEHASALYAEEQKLRARLELSTGPLFAASLVRLSSGSRLLLAGHELVLDAASWRLLEEDLTALLRAPNGAAAPRAKTASVKRWSERLADEATAEDVRKEEAVWLAGPWEGLARLPVDRADGATGTVRTHTVGLTEEETRQLTERLSTTWRAELEEGALAALVQALSSWTGSTRLLLDVRSNGRESFDGLDCSRTVGPFTVTWPLTLELGESATPDALKAVKERMRRVPRKGLGFALLRDGAHGELSEKLRRLPRAEVAFQHLGSSAPSESTWPGGYLLEVETFLSGDRLHVRVSGDDGAYRGATLGQLAENVLGALRALCNEEQARPAISAVDFPLTGLDDSQLGMLAQLIQDADES